MNYKWFNKNNNSNLIVFFNGWGMDEKIVSHLKYENNDILIFYDYRTFGIENFDFSSYQNKTLIAWSLGVYVCNYFYETFKNFNNYIAINGTQKPIDNNYGIPKAIYDLTVNNFNELSCAKFMSKISSSVNLKDYTTRSTKELKQELISIRDLTVSNYFKFNKAIVSLKDRIIPSKNQISYWNTQNIEPLLLNESHSIFDKHKSWDELL